jgi:hypothetical protein
MKKGKLLRIAILVILLVGLYLFFQGGQLFVKQVPPAPPEVQTEPPATPSAAPLENVSSVSSGVGDVSQSSSLALSPAPRTGDLSQASSDYSYSIKKPEKKELQILPGVSYVPKEGVSIKTASKDETIQIQRDRSYNTDYQVLWKKKY